MYRGYIELVKLYLAGLWNQWLGCPCRNVELTLLYSWWDSEHISGWLGRHLERGSDDQKLGPNHHGASGAAEAAVLQTEKYLAWFLIDWSPQKTLDEVTSRPTDEVEVQVSRYSGSHLLAFNYVKPPKRGMFWPWNFQDCTSYNWHRTSPLSMGQNSEILFIVSWRQNHGPPNKGIGIWYNVRPPFDSYVGAHNSNNYGLRYL